jgi:putative CocE/NonD family hydrolase
LAALRPPALRAVVTICSTDDRYADDIHYMGGVPVSDQLSWASIMLGINTLPPDPKHVGDKWREMWHRRLDESGLWLGTWLNHQTRDDFWRHGSVCENWDDIQVPVYAVSGWADGYCNAVFRLVENLRSPAKGIVGPWSHRYPHLGAPGPAIDWLSEETRWWDHWLKGRDTGIMDEPSLRLFLQDHAEPRSHYETRDRGWIGQPSWPSPHVESVAVALGSDKSLCRGAGKPGPELSICSALWVGFRGGKWCSYGLPGDQPVDQRHDDSGSLVFETGPLDSDLHVVGAARLRLRCRVDRPVAQIAVRLVDVAPDGAATRFSYGLLNLCHRDGHATPTDVVPGEDMTVEVPLRHIAQTLRAGHRLRLSLSTSYFPIAWPTPEPVTLTVLPGESELSLPLQTAPEFLPDFPPPRAGAPLALAVHQEPGAEWRVTEDMDTGRVTVETRDHEGAATIKPQQFFHSAEGRERYSILPADPTSAEGEVTWVHEMSRDGWAVKTETWTRLTCDATSYHIAARLQAWCDDVLEREHAFAVSIPRRFS